MSRNEKSLRAKQGCGSLHQTRLRLKVKCITKDKKSQSNRLSFVIVQQKCHPMNERVTFNMKEIKRHHVIQQIENHQMTGSEASLHLGLSQRQIRRILAKYRAEGPPGLLHGNRGRTANNRVDECVRVKIQELAEKEYRDYNDSQFTEELVEEHGLIVSRSTVRRIRRAIGQKSPRKHRSPRHRSRRERKSKAGMLLQAERIRIA
jgi:transposase